MSCRSVCHLLHVDATALAEVDRILLEDHLGRCTACVRARELLVRVKHLARSVPLDPLGPAAHQRAIAKAMLRGSAPAIDTASRARYIVLGGALACVATLAIWITTRDARPATQHPPVAVAPDAAIVAPPIAIAPDAAVAPSTLDAQPEPGLVVLDDRAPRFVLPGGFVADGSATLRVTPTAVTVTRGSVAIFASDGTTRVAVIVAGESWTLPDSPRASAKALLDRARRAFDARDCRAAETHAQAALVARPTRPQSAEARTLLAECAQAAGKLDRALQHYDAIAERFSDLFAGETALLAAARLELSRGSSSGARERFERYLKRYPQGRFIDDARRQLEAIKP